MIEKFKKQKFKKTMKLLKILFGVILLVLIGGFIYFSVTDITISRHTVSKDISHERLLQE